MKEIDKIDFIGANEYFEFNENIKFNYNLKKGTCKGAIIKGDFSATYSLHYQIFDNHMLVYCLQIN